MARKPQQSPAAGESRERKDVPLNIRVAEAEKQAFQLAAENAGVPLSSWMRERLRRIARTELENADIPVPFVKNRF